MAKADIVAKIHLVISVVIVVPAAITYGFFSDLFLDLSPQTIDEENFFKSVMGLYLGLSMLWILGIFNKNYLKLALISNLIFMFGLASGRLLSMLIDGIPSHAYVIGTLGEFILGFYGLWILNSKYIKKL